MTIKVSKKMRKRIDKEMKKRIAAEKVEYMANYRGGIKNKRELVTDQSHKDIHKKNLIYESPDGGETIYRAEIDLSSDSTAHVYKPVHDDVSGVKIDKPDQLEFEFDEFKADTQYQAGYSDAMVFMEEVGDKISQVATLLGEVTEGINKLRDNN